MSSTRNMMLVGGITLLAIVLLASALFLVLGSDILERHTHKQYFVVFESTQGPDEGTEIKLGGKVIGHVKSSRFVREEGLTRSKITILDTIELFPGTEFKFKQELLGDKYLLPEYERLSPSGEPWEESDAVAAGYEFGGEMGVDPLDSLTDMVEPLKGTLKNVNAMLDPEQLGALMRPMQENLNETLGHVNSLLEMVGTFMEANEGNISASTTNMRLISESFVRLSQDLEETGELVNRMAADPRYRETAERVLANLDESSAALNDMTKQINALVSDPAVQQDAKDSVRLTKETLQEAKDTMERFQTTLDTVDETMKSAQGLMGEAEGAITDVRSKVDQASGLGDAVDVKLGFNVRAVDVDDDQHLDNEDIYVGDLNAAIGYGNTYVSVGADNIGEDSNANFLLGYGSLSGLSFRGGVYRGELGLGPAYYFPGGGGAEFMLYDTEDPKLNGYGYLPLSDHLRMVLGVEDIENDPQASIGLGVEF